MMENQNASPSNEVIDGEPTEFQKVESLSTGTSPAVGVWLHQWKSRLIMSVIGVVALCLIATGVSVLSKQAELTSSSKDAQIAGQLSSDQESLSTSTALGELVASDPLSPVTPNVQDDAANVTAYASPTTQPTTKPKSTTKPTATLAPVTTPLPMIDVTIDSSDARRPGSSTCEGQPIWCETMNPEIAVVYYYLNLKNNGSQPAENIVVEVAINGATQRQTTRTIQSSETAQMIFTLPGEPGTHSTSFVVNPDKNPPETSYDNNSVSYSYTIYPDAIAPTASLEIVNRPPDQKCFSPYVSDNVTQESDLKLELQIDEGSWKEIPARVSPSSEYRYEECLVGSNGQSHIGNLKVTDRRGNNVTVSKTMNF